MTDSPDLKQMKALARRLRTQGWSYLRLAAKFNRSYTTIRRWCDADFAKSEKERNRKDQQQRRHTPAMKLRRKIRNKRRRGARPETIERLERQLQHLEHGQ